MVYYVIKREIDSIYANAVRHWLYFGYIRQVEGVMVRCFNSRIEPILLITDDWDILVSGWLKDELLADGCVLSPYIFTHSFSEDFLDRALQRNMESRREDGWRLLQERSKELAGNIYDYYRVDGPEWLSRGEEAVSHFVPVYVRGTKHRPIVPVAIPKNLRPSVFCSGGSLVLSERLFQRVVHFVDMDYYGISLINLPDGA